MKNRLTEKERAEIENARVGYQVATNLWIHEGTLFWSRFHGMVLANSVILGGVALSMTAPVSGFLPCMFRILLALTGILVCLVWCLMTKRSAGYHDYWIHSARLLEERYLWDTVRTVSRGKAFAEGTKVVLPGVKEPLKISGRPRIRQVSYWLIYAFGALYVLILLYGVYEYVNLVVNMLVSLVMYLCGK